MRKMLFQFGAGYFHQDYELEYPTPDAAILDFREDQTDEEIAQLIREIDGLLSGVHTEAEFEEVWLRESCAYYEPSRNGYTYQTWFEHVRDVLLAK